MKTTVTTALRALAGLPLLVVAYTLADFGAYATAFQVREWARWVAGINAPKGEN